MRDRFEIFENADAVEATNTDGYEFQVERIGGKVFIVAEAGREERAQVVFTAEQWEVVKAAINRI